MSTPPKRQTLADLTTDLLRDVIAEAHRNGWMWGYDYARSAGFR